MDFRHLVDAFRDRPFFESRELAMLFDEPAGQVQARLSRWVRQGKLVQLRRGRYLLPERYRREEASVFYVANYLYRPSYVSLETALEHYGLIPEAVGVTLSVSPLHGREWHTPMGIFRYRSIRDDRFWGYQEERLTRAGDRGRQGRFLIAHLEKAILDLFYLEPGEWTKERLEALRLQNLGSVEPDRLRDFAARFGSPKVERAAGRLAGMVADR